MKTGKEMKELNNKELEMICGGNEGDTAKDNDPNNSMYKKGDKVKVYGCHLLFWDFFEEDKEIIDAEWQPGPKRWWYTASDSPVNRWEGTADSIIHD